MEKPNIECKVQGQGHEIGEPISAGSAALISAIIAAGASAATTAATTTVSSLSESKGKRKQVGTMCNDTPFDLKVYAQGQPIHGSWNEPPKFVEHMRTEDEAFSDYRANNKYLPDWIYIDGDRANPITSPEQLTDWQKQDVASWLETLDGEGKTNYLPPNHNTFFMNSTGNGVEGLVLYQLEGLIPDSNGDEPRYFNPGWFVMIYMHTTNVKGKVYAGGGLYKVVTRDQFIDLDQKIKEQPKLTDYRDSIAQKTSIKDQSWVAYTEGGTDSAAIIELTYPDSSDEEVHGYKYLLELSVSAGLQTTFHLKLKRSDYVSEEV